MTILWKILQKLVIYMPTIPRGSYRLMESVEYEQLLEEKAPTNFECPDFSGRKVVNWG